MTASTAQQAFCDLVDRHGPALLGYLTRRVTITEDAADLLNEVLLVTWRRWDAVPASPQDRPWLFGVARNVLANHVRSTRRRDTATHALVQTLRQVNAPEPSATVLDARAAIAALEPIDQEILTLTVWEGLTSAQVAAVVDLPSSTVRARLARARTLIQARLVIEPVDVRTSPKADSVQTLARARLPPPSTSYQ